MPKRNKKTNIIPVVDLFAGPGGLGEGFSACKTNSHQFRIRVSIEKDQHAHKTLLLRAFYRQFEHGQAPDEYYKFITSKKFSINKLDKLLNDFELEGQAARNEALCLELGKDNNIIFENITQTIGHTINNNSPWVLIGGPPCQAYSLAGRVRNRGIEGWSLETDARSELYKEYLSILAKFQPAVFIMENVKGILSAKMNGKSLVNRIFSDLQEPNRGCKMNTLSNSHHKYHLYSLVKECKAEETSDPHDFLIKSEDYGIPQKRHRVIILGVRDDYDPDDNINILVKLAEKKTVNDAIGDLPAVYSHFSKKNGKKAYLDTTLLKYESWYAMIAEYFKDWKNSNTNVNNKLNDYIGKINKGKPGLKPECFNPSWYYNPKLDGTICNHEPRT
ncbi:MAG: DNA cytosine methyltransferase, partial [Phycisphaerae bacterium]|nr:DNA cytosine methyltransferase [Phycisphaerae bacterium]